MARTQSSPASTSRSRDGDDGLDAAGARLPPANVARANARGPACSALFDAPTSEIAAIPAARPASSLARIEIVSNRFESPWRVQLITARPAAGKFSEITSGNTSRRASASSNLFSYRLPSRIRGASTNRPGSTSVPRHSRPPSSTGISPHSFTTRTTSATGAIRAGRPLAASAATSFSACGRTHGCSASMAMTMSGVWAAGFSATNRPTRSAWWIQTSRPSSRPATAGCSAAATCTTASATAPLMSSRTRSVQFPPAAFTGTRQTDS